MALAGSSSRRYAEALLEIAAAEGAVPAYRAALERLRDAIAPDVVRALRDRHVPIAQRRAALEAATKAEPRAIRAVLVILLERDRIGILPDVARAYSELVDRREGVVHAKIATSIELDQRRRDELTSALERTSGAKISATFSTDPALLGGARVQLGDRLIDTSVRAQLEAMRAQLAS